MGNADDEDRSVWSKVLCFSPTDMRKLGMLAIYMIVKIFYGKIQDRARSAAFLTSFVAASACFVHLGVCKEESPDDYQMFSSPGWSSMMVATSLMVHMLEQSRLAPGAYPVPRQLACCAPARKVATKVVPVQIALRVQESSPSCPTRPIDVFSLGHGSQSVDIRTFQIHLYG